ncbi:Uncharacterised protein [Bordetella pertussis]|nr:Uncharacterised protein [Bordetella pertussis]
MGACPRLGTGTHGIPGVCPCMGTGTHGVALSACPRGDRHQYPAPPLTLPAPFAPWPGIRPCRTRPGSA